MKLASVKARILKNRSFDNWKSTVEGRWTIEDLRSDVAYCNEWISFDCLAWDESSKQLYIGLTSINNDIFYVYDPSRECFTSLDFRSFGDRFDAKFHRSLEIGEDGMIYAATALLHDMDQQHQASGGKLLRYDPARRTYQCLAVPVPHHYIQSILLDRRRRILYGFTYPAEYLFRYDLESGECRTLAYIGNSVMMCQPHCAALDRNGHLWGTWGETRAFEDQLGSVPVRLFCYNPDENHVTWFSHGFPKTTPDDPARVDHMFLSKDGWIYTGTVAGGFSRLDPDTARVEDLGKPYPKPRLAGLVDGPGGLIYGVGNAGYGEDGRGQARLFTFDPRTKIIQDLGPLFDELIGAGAAKVHMLVVTGEGTLYAGENDNTLRSSFLWECQVTAS